MDYRHNAIVTGYSELNSGDIAAYMQKSFNAQEAEFVEKVISAIESTLVRECNRNFAYGDSYVYYQILNAGECHYSSYNYPIKEVTKIQLDGADKYVKGGGSNTYTLNTDFFVYEDYIEFVTIPYSESNNRRALKIFHTIDQFWGDDVALAIQQFVADEIGKRQYNGRRVNSFSFAGLSVSFGGRDLPSYVQRVIETYKKVLI